MTEPGDLTDEQIDGAARAAADYLQGIGALPINVLVLATVFQPGSGRPNFVIGEPVDVNPWDAMGLIAVADAKYRGAIMKDEIG